MTTLDSDARAAGPGGARREVDVLDGAAPPPDGHGALVGGDDRPLLGARIRSKARWLGFAIFAALVLAVVTGGRTLSLGLLGALVVLVTLSRTRWAALLFIFALYLNIPAVATQLHGVPSAVASASVLLLAVPFASYLVFQRQPLVVTVTLPLMLVYFASLLGSTAVSSSPEISLPAVVVFLTEGLVLFFLVTNVVRTAAMVRQVIWVLLIAGSIMGALSIYQEVTGTYENTYGGLAQVSEGQFKIGEDVDGKETRNRLAGPIGEQNRYAQVLLVLMPLVIVRARAERKRWLRLAAAGAGLLILGGILLTFSRGAAVAGAVVLLLLVVIREVRLRHVLGLAAVLVVVTSLVAPDFVVRVASLEGVGALNSEDSSEPDGAILGRATSNLAAWNVFSDHPFLGVGPSQYFRLYSEEAANDLDLRRFDSNRRAHNLYLEIAADSGMIGLLSFLAAVGATMVQLFRLRRRFRATRPDLASYATSFLVALVAYLVTGTFLQLSYQRYFWILVALAASVVWVLQREEPGPAAQVGGPELRPARAG